MFAVTAISSAIALLHAFSSVYGSSNVGPISKRSNNNHISNDHSRKLAVNNQKYLTPLNFLSTIVNLDADLYMDAWHDETCFLAGYTGSLSDEEIALANAFLQLDTIKAAMRKDYLQTVQAQKTQFPNSEQGRKILGWYAETASDTTYQVPQKRSHIVLLADLYFGFVKVRNPRHLSMFKAVSRIEFGAYADALASISAAYHGEGSSMDVASLFKIPEIDKQWLITRMVKLTNDGSRESAMRILTDSDAFQALLQLIDTSFSNPSDVEGDELKRRLADLVKFYRSTMLYRQKVKRLIFSFGNVTVNQVQDILDGKLPKFDALTAFEPILYFIPDLSYLSATPGFAEFVFPLMSDDAKLKYLLTAPNEAVTKLFPGKENYKPSGRFNMATILTALWQTALQDKNQLALSNSAIVWRKFDYTANALFDFFDFVDANHELLVKNGMIFAEDAAFKSLLFDASNEMFAWFKRPYRLFLYMAAKSYAMTGSWPCNWSKLVSAIFHFAIRPDIVTDLRDGITEGLREYGFEGTLDPEIFNVDPKDSIIGAQIYTNGIIAKCTGVDFTKTGPITVSVEYNSKKVQLTFNLPGTFRNVDLYFLVMSFAEDVFMLGTFLLVDAEGKVILPDDAKISPSLHGTTIQYNKPKQVTDSVLQACKLLDIQFKP